MVNVEESADQSLFQSIGDRKQLEATKSQHPGRAEVPYPVPGNTHGLSVLRVLWLSSTENRPVPSSWLLLHSHRHRGVLFTRHILWWATKLDPRAPETTDKMLLLPHRASWGLSLFQSLYV